MIRFDSFQIKWIGLKFPENFAQINFMLFSRRTLGMSIFMGKSRIMRKSLLHRINISEIYVIACHSPDPLTRNRHTTERKNICFRTFQEPIMRVSPDEIHAQRQRKEFAERLLVIGKTRQDDEREKRPRKIK